MFKGFTTRPIYFTGKDDKFVGAVFTCRDKDIVIKKDSSVTDVEQWVNLVAWWTSEFSKDFFDFESSNTDVYHNKKTAIIKTLMLHNYNVKPLIKKSIFDLKQEISTLAERREGLDRDSDEDRILEKQIDELVSFKNKLQLLEKFKKTEKKEGFITEQDIEKARDYPITELLPFDRSGFTHCIFHSENTPSMKYYTTTNTVHCFGCSKSHDSISIYMEQNKVDFITAVKQMSK